MVPHTLLLSKVCGFYLGGKKLGSKEQEELRKQLFETNLSLALLKRSENYLYNPEYRDLRMLKIKLDKLLKKLALKAAEERKNSQEKKEGRKL